jgi:uncharacterized coiled-coil DUF342 family protein
MAELTAEQFHQEMEKFYQRLDRFRKETDQSRQATDNNINQLRDETSSGFEQVLDTMQAFHDGQRDELVGINGRLRAHSERIARLERLNHLKESHA